MAGKVTGADIAKLAHVSSSTVSRALDPRSSWRISAEKRKRILALCEEHGYSLASHKSKSYPKTFKVGLLLGFMDADLKNISFMIRQLCDHLQASGYALTLIRVDFSSSEMSRHVRRIIRSNIADIYIVGEYLLQGQTPELLHKVSSRVICFYTTMTGGKYLKHYPWISSIGYDYEAAFMSAVEQLPENLLADLVFFGKNNEPSADKIHLLRKCLRQKGKASSVFLKSCSDQGTGLLCRPGDTGPGGVPCVRKSAACWGIDYSGAPAVLRPKRCAMNCPTAVWFADGISRL